jgi:transcriptional regulator
VPTWNYAVVHAYGRARLLEAAELGPHLKELVDSYEAGFAEPWKIESLPVDFVANLQKQIVGFEIQITRLEGKWKMGQNRTNADRQGAIDGLLRGGDAIGGEVAELMSAALSADRHS